jgi:molybdopterin-guanine dinucleotide biosynthesis protein A
MLTVCIQAGGQSSRMGEDKALKTFLGRPLIQRVAERLAPIADEMIVTTNHPEDYRFLDTSTRPTPALAPGASVGQSVRSLRLVADLKPGRGALGGLYTAIASASRSMVAVVACDMPFASATLLRRASRILIEEEMDVVIPQSEEGYEPLHAVYRRETCLPAIESAINADQWKVIAWFPQVKVRVLTPQEIQEYDPSGLAFWNVNTPEEFVEAEKIATSQ